MTTYYFIIDNILRCVARLEHLISKRPTGHNDGTFLRGVPTINQINQALSVRVLYLNAQDFRIKTGNSNVRAY